MRRVLTALVAVVAITVAVGTPAGGQEFGDPEFGPLSITPDGGNPGDIVDAKVDAAVVADQCITDVQGVMDWMGSTWLGVSDPAAVTPGPVSQAWIDLGPLVGIDIPDPWPGIEFGGTWFNGPGPPPAGVDPQGWAWQMYNDGYSSLGGGGDPFWIEGSFPNSEQNAAAIIFEVMDLIGQNFDGLAQELLARTFVLTFADVATQELIGEPSTFDPATGFGQVTVPDVPPGEYAVAATCVEPVVTDESFLAAAEAGAAYMESNAVPFTTSLLYCVVEDPDTGECVETLPEGLVSVMLPELVQPQAGPWVELFCVGCEPLPSDDDLAAFCGVLPQIQGVPDRLGSLFAGVAIDDPATYPSVDALESLVTDVKALVDGGDTSVPPTVRPQWLIATEDLRELIFGLTAVGFDFQLVVDFAPDQAERLIDEGSGEGEPNPEFDAALEVLTAFFVDNCIAPGGPGGEAGPATPTAGVARFTG